MAYDEVLAARVRDAAGPDLAEKRMFGGIAFLLSGNMAVGVHGDDLIVRVEPTQTAALLREPGAKPFDLSGGRTPAGWLLVDPTGYRTEATLRAWVGRGIAYASSLPKKPQKQAKGRRK